MSPSRAGFLQTNQLPGRSAQLLHPQLRPQPIAPGPQSQYLSRGYGYMLPTSLTYILPSTRGCSPWRPDAVIGTTRSANKALPQIFTGPHARSERPAFAGRYRQTTKSNTPSLAAPSPDNPLPGQLSSSSRLLTRTDNSRRGACRRSLSGFVLGVAARVSTSWRRNLYRLPFRAY